MKNPTVEVPKGFPWRDLGPGLAWVEDENEKIKSSRICCFRDVLNTQITN